MTPDRNERREVIALTEARDAVAFFDRVKAASADEKMAVGTDHWVRMEAALRAVAALPAVAIIAAEDARREGEAEGFVLVPREPTEAMLRAFWRRHFDDGGLVDNTDRGCYAAMLAALPKGGV